MTGEERLGDGSDGVAVGNAALGGPDRLLLFRGGIAADANALKRLARPLTRSAQLKDRICAKGQFAGFPPYL